ncbi:MAG: hypothetical protein O8C64_07245 [Candidatus Methanoperedens sp.]|nr:hypothetical protein [Candidatus Methanoperedens sp.]MCZ7405489.1 hypothetical protein [Candidatus Methanoperedens sp.]
MRKKTVLVIGILGILLVFGAAVALAQNTSEKINDAGNHECTPEMMENMPKNCPEQMMQSETCKGMMNAANESSMMNNEATGENHCGDMGSDMSSMMVSSGSDMKSMM